MKRVLLLKEVGHKILLGLKSYITQTLVLLQLFTANIMYLCLRWVLLAIGFSVVSAQTARKE